MSLRQKFEGVGCKRFGDGDQAETNTQDKSKGKKPAWASAADRDEIAALEATIAGLKKQVASQALEIAELRGTKKDKNSPSIGKENQAVSKRGRPKLPDDERDRRRRKQKAAANKKARERHGA